MKEKIKIVYKHTDKKTLVPFYIGSGLPCRAKDFWTRKDSWKNYVKENGNPIVEILHSGLSTDEAIELERKEILKIGRLVDNTGPLLNIMLGRSRCETTKVKISNSTRGVSKKKMEQSTKDKLTKHFGLKIIYEGVEYNSIRECSRETGKGRNTIKRHLRKLNII
jgi:hypothetical protein